MKIFVSIFFCIMQLPLIAQNLGKYYPFPEQEKAIELVFDDKNCFAITETKIMKESDGFFLAKYAHNAKINCVLNDSDKLFFEQMRVCILSTN